MQDARRTERGEMGRCTLKQEREREREIGEDGNKEIMRVCNIVRLKV